MVKSNRSTAIWTIISSGSATRKNRSPRAATRQKSGNSAQARKDQKRREAELRSQTQPLRKEIARLEKEMDKLNAQLASAEEKLGDSELYDASRKAELTECLQQQASAKSGLEECEMARLEAQEQLGACFRKANAASSFCLRRRGQNGFLPFPCSGHQ